MEGDGQGYGEGPVLSSGRPVADLRGYDGAEQEAEKPLAQLLGEFSKEISLLVHQEVQLAEVELTEKGKRLGAGAALFAAATLCGLLAAGALAACAIVALALVLPLWLGALIVGVVCLAAAGVFARAGLGEARRASPPVPSQALESTKEDVAWLQKQIKSAKR